MNKRALVVGSVAFDVLFDVHGTIRDRIVFKNGKPGRQNLMFTSGLKESRFGGTGGNIAYGLGLLGEKPILFSSAGRDFLPDFHAHLKSRGVDMRVHVEKRSWTAVFYGMSDEMKEQIGVWQPNAHDLLETISLTDFLDKKTLKDVSVAIFCGKPSIALRHMRDVRKLSGRKVKIIFDPGQAVVSYDKTALLKALSLADIFIVNDVELGRAESILKQDRKDIFKLGPTALIETKGEDGSVLYEKGKTTRIPARKPGRVVETTGAGDAYRAGFMFGLLHGWPLPKACRLGARLGAKNVETVGGQGYRLSKKELAELRA